MKRFLFAGLALIVLTLCSCSRKKAAQTQEGVSSESDLVLNIDPDRPQLADTELAAAEEIDEEFLAEEERHGTEVLSFLEDEANFTSPIIQTEEEPAAETEEGEAPQVEAVEKRLLDAYNRLKVMEYDTELFVPVNNQDSSVMIHYSNKAAVRLFYDEIYRLTKKEYWKMDSVETARITGTEKYSYEGESKKPYEKTIENESTVFVSKLNENGLVIRTEKFEILEDGSKGKTPQTVTTWTYDEKDRITSETVRQDKLTKKQVFNYSKTDGIVETAKVHGKDEAAQTEEGDDSKQELPPDFEYYENGILVTKTEYVKKGVYSTTIWFDSDNYVRTDYENYIKVRDVYYTNGVERRVKKYE